jgi:hypothetical protein
MGLRLARWWNRGGASAGRHVRVMPAASVPGAASTLVSSVSLDPIVTGVAPVLPEPHLPPRAPQPFEGPVVPPAAREVSDVATAGVALVFADGARVELDADDPRVRTFRAAAAALIEPSPH